MSADAVKKLPGLHKTSDVTLKRTALQGAQTEDSSMKKLPRKRRPQL
jgi:hypothetical protein